MGLCASRKKKYIYECEMNNNNKYNNLDNNIDNNILLKSYNIQ